MPIQYHPPHGSVVFCDFHTGGFKPPEMVKQRPCVVLSIKGKALATVVPLSGSAPEEVLLCHYAMPAKSLPEHVAKMSPLLAKCDMVTTVAFHRLSFVKSRMDEYGKTRAWDKRRIGEQDLREIKTRVAKTLGIGKLDFLDT
jgi:uncharacterized protein YifN (PemK superfamily)